MDRDRRLTGTLRGQSDNPQAPLGFEFTNGWKVISLPIYNSFFHGQVLIQYAAGEAIYLKDHGVQSELLEEGASTSKSKQNRVYIYQAETRLR